MNQIKIIYYLLYYFIIHNSLSFLIMSGCVHQDGNYFHISSEYFVPLAYQISIEILLHITETIQQVGLLTHMM